MSLKWRWYAKSAILLMNNAEILCEAYAKGVAAELAWIS